MSEEKFHKKDKNRAQRLLRLVLSIFDPRAYAHAFKIVNYYNYTHLVELRKASLGTDPRISPTASFANGQNIAIGDRARIGAGCYLWAGPGVGRIVIGNDALLGPGVMLSASNYRFNDGRPVTAQAMDEGDILVGDDVWFGYGAVILAGVTIGDGAIIGASAVVRRDVPPNAIVAGNPSKVIGSRDLSKGEDTVSSAEMDR